MATLITGALDGDAVAALQALQAVDAKIMLVEDVKNSGTRGGSSIAGIQTKDLNSVTHNSITGASLSSNQITLPAGKFLVSGSCPACRSDNHNAFVYNITSSSIALIGGSAFNDDAVNVATRSLFIGVIDLSDDAVFEVRHYTENVSASDSLGKATLYTASGDGEVYTQLYIQKIG